MTGHGKRPRDPGDDRDEKRQLFVAQVDLDFLSALEQSVRHGTEGRWGNWEVPEIWDSLFGPAVNMGDGRGFKI